MYLLVFGTLGTCLLCIFVPVEGQC